MGDREYLPSGDELRKRRNALGLSQREMARRLGVDQTHVSHLEHDFSISARAQMAYIALLDELEAARA